MSALPELSREEVDVAVAAIRAEENLPPPKQNCNLCKDNPNNAIVWCMDCQKCICDNHLEVIACFDNCAVGLHVHAHAVNISVLSCNRMLHNCLSMKSIPGSLTHQRYCLYTMCSTYSMAFNKSVGCSMGVYYHRRRATSCELSPN